MTTGWGWVRLFLALAAAGLGLATVFALSARLWWAFDLFSHFRLQYVVAALVLGGVALAVRAYPTAAVLGVIALVHGWAIKDLWVGGAALAAPGGVPLRVVTANVLDGNPAPERVLEFVRAADADLVVLVDALSERWDEVLAGLGDLYPYRAPEGWRDGAPVVLLSRHPVLASEVVRPVEGGRPYVAAEIAVGERRLVLVGVHPASPSPDDASDTHRRNWQLAHIAASVEGVDQPVVVAGDFNTTPWSPQFRDLVAAAGLRNAAAGQGWIATWPRWFWPARIPLDHVLVRGPVVVASLERGPAIGSDHFPVIADLRLVGG